VPGFEGPCGAEIGRRCHYCRDCKAKANNCHRRDKYRRDQELDRSADGRARLNALDSAVELDEVIDYTRGGFESSQPMRPGSSAQNRRHDYTEYVRLQKVRELTEEDDGQLDWSGDLGEMAARYAERREADSRKVDFHAAPGAEARDAARGCRASSTAQGKELMLTTCSPRVPGSTKAEAKRVELGLPCHTSVSCSLAVRPEGQRYYH
jgi:hypothetical protein